MNLAELSKLFSLPSSEDEIRKMMKSSIKPEDLLAMLENSRDSIDMCIRMLKERIDKRNEYEARTGIDTGERRIEGDKTEKSVRGRGITPGGPNDSNSA